VTQARWWLEEYRVSLFAQELKTAVPVSAKRIQTLLSSVKRT
jgi:ATP-dependent helicase HrpA